MERLQGFVVKGGIKLPIGFRFCPTDQELLLHYLKNKAFALQLPASVISDCDVFQTDPWLLPGSSQFFFSFFLENKIPSNFDLPLFQFRNF